ncbi:YdcF family protein [Streptomyces sp. N35]|uniref:YdcF family protein n=1 Tax=Streptomyces sp. N35 TaxID=2795730 RepID=UPI0018F50C4D|nr:YdcF family protein [Streptomyces sp. N35]
MELAERAVRSPSDRAGGGKSRYRKSTLTTCATATIVSALLLASCTTGSSKEDANAASGVASATATGADPSGDNAFDRVKSLIDQANNAFTSPARSSTAGNTSTLESNNRTIATKLLAAHELAPYRSDLLFSAATAKIANDDVPGAIKLYKEILRQNPKDLDALSYLATWARYSQDQPGVDSAMGQIKAIAPERFDDLNAVFADIDTNMSAPITDRPDIGAPSGATTAIVVLGYALNDDGSMAQPLIDRLEKALEASKEVPRAPIIVTGGVEKAGNIEAELMSKWLTDRGVKSDRMHLESYATSTVENASYSFEIFNGLNVDRVILITSGSHMRRASTIFQVTSNIWKRARVTYVGLSALDKSAEELATPTSIERISIYRDSMSSLGLWSYRTAPILRR